MKSIDALDYLQSPVERSTDLELLKLQASHLRACHEAMDPEILGPCDRVARIQLMLEASEIQKKMRVTFARIVYQHN